MTEEQSNKIQEVADKLAVEAWKELGNNKIFIDLNRTKTWFDNALQNTVKDELSIEAKEAIRWLSTPFASNMTVKEAREEMRDRWSEAVLEEIKEYVK